MVASRDLQGGLVCVRACAGGTCSMPLGVKEGIVCCSEGGWKDTPDAELGMNCLGLGAEPKGDCRGEIAGCMPGAPLNGL